MPADRGPQPLRASMEATADRGRLHCAHGDMVHPVLITGPARPAIPRARQPRLGAMAQPDVQVGNDKQRRPNDRLGAGNRADEVVAGSPPGAK
jgi:hypothetical protein